jgi:hypothetical protein
VLRHTLSEQIVDATERQMPEWFTALTLEFLKCDVQQTSQALEKETLVRWRVLHNGTFARYQVMLATVLLFDQLPNGQIARVWLRIGGNGSSRETGDFCEPISRSARDTIRDLPVRVAIIFGLVELACDCCDCCDCMTASADRGPFFQTL